MARRFDTVDLARVGPCFWRRGKRQIFMLPFLAEEADYGTVSKNTMLGTALPYLDQHFRGWTVWLQRIYSRLEPIHPV